jgi:hypothetical protein
MSTQTAENFAEEKTTPEVKRYQRQKLVVRLISMAIALTYLITLAFWAVHRLTLYCESGSAIAFGCDCLASWWFAAGEWSF